jgi:uncharacterized membrane protein YqjE
MVALGRSLADIASQVVTLVATRLELLGLEALQVRDRLLWRLAVLLAAVFLLMLALLVATVAFALSVWPTEQRTLALSLLAAGYAVLGVLLLLWLWARYLRGPEPFEATAEVLKADARMLSGAATAPGEPPSEPPPPSTEPTQMDGDRL